MTKKIGVFCSGGDAPGMNACTRAVVRRALNLGFDVYAIREGFNGIFNEEIDKLESRDVSNIIQTGGAVIKTARSKEFYNEEGQKKAAAILDKHGFDAVVGIGGNGTMQGLHALGKFWKGQIIGAPGTIDNDIFGSDVSIGFDTAVNTALEAIDRIRDTAGAHQRNFIIEVMGRNAGFIALEVGIAGGSEEVLLPEQPVDWESMAKRLKENKAHGKNTNMVILAEGAENLMGAHNASLKLEELTGAKWRYVILGYIQRGGSPTATDRVLATKLGAYAVDCISENKSNIMVGVIDNKLSETPLVTVYTKKKPLDQYALNLVTIIT